MNAATEPSATEPRGDEILDLTNNTDVRLFLMINELKSEILMLQKRVNILESLLEG